MTRSFTPLLALLLLAPGLDGQVRRSPTLPSRPLAAPLDVPMAMAEGRPVVQVHLDGHGPFPFIVDTGAMGSLIDAELATELGLSAVGRAMVGDPSGQGARPVEVFMADRLALGDTEVDGVRLVGLDDEALFERLGARGILSPFVFGGNVVTFDFPGARLRVEPGTLGEGPGVLPFAADSPIPNVELSIGDLRIVADLDTGNGRGSVGLPGRLRGEVPLAGELVSDSARTVGGAFEVLVGRIDGTVRIGDVVLDGPDVFFQDRFDRANLGAAAFRDLVLSLDPASRRVRLVAGGGAGGAGARGAGALVRRGTGASTVRVPGSIGVVR